MTLAVEKRLRQAVDRAWNAMWAAKDEWNWYARYARHDKRYEAQARNWQKRFERERSRWDQATLKLQEAMGS